MTRVSLASERVQHGQPAAIPLVAALQTADTRVTAVLSAANCSTCGFIASTESTSALTSTACCQQTTNVEGLTVVVIGTEAQLRHHAVDGLVQQVDVQVDRLQGTGNCSFGQGMTACGVIKTPRTISVRKSCKEVLAQIAGTHVQRLDALCVADNFTARDGRN